MEQLNRPEARQITDVTTGEYASNIGDIPKFEKTVWLSSPTMHGDELKYMTEAYTQNWCMKDNRDNHINSSLIDKAI